MKCAMGLAGVLLASAMLALPGIRGARPREGRANIAPVAIISTRPTAPFLVNETIYFDGTVFVGLRRRPGPLDVAFSGLRLRVQHQPDRVNWSFNRPGNYIVVLMVIDDDGAQSAASINVRVDRAREPGGHIGHRLGGLMAFTGRSFFSSEGPLTTRR